MMDELEASSVIITDGRAFSFVETLSATLKARCFPFAHFTSISDIDSHSSTC